jgi:outer membrane protein assembly factor BamD (BamD/ComL family)
MTTASRNEREFADHYLQIARLLLAYGRTEVARRRLKRVVDRFGNTPAAAESKNLLTALENPAESGRDDRHAATAVRCGQAKA